MTSQEIDRLRLHNRFPVVRAIALGAAVFVSLWTVDAHATTYTYTVNSNADNGVNCTLRLAVAAANGASNNCVGTPSSSTIVQLGGAGATSISLSATAGPMVVNGNMTIQGNYNGLHPNFDDVVVSTTTGGRIFQVLGGTLNLSNLRLTGASSASDNGPAIAIDSTGTVTLNTVQIDHCTGWWGGAIYSAGNLTVSASSLHDNHAAVGGAIYDASVTFNVNTTTFSSNAADQDPSTGLGGAIYIAPNTSSNYMDRKIETSTFSQNQGFFGGAIAIFNRFIANADTFDGNHVNSVGGALYVAATAQVFNSTFTGNAASGGGAVYRDTTHYPGVYWVFDRNTVVFNAAAGAGGGLDIVDQIGTVGNDNIIWSNTAPSGPDVYATFFTGSTCPDWVGNMTGSTHPPSDCLTGNPSLGSYVSVDGRPKCYALNSNSLAIDAGHGSDPYNLYDTVDQRGFKRPVPGKANVVASWDMGSYEYDPPKLAIVDIVGIANVDGDAGKHNDVVAVGRAGTDEAGHVFVGISNTAGTGVTYWSWVSTNRMIDDGAKVWLADVNGDGKADLVTQGAATGTHAGWISVGLSDGLGFTQWSWTSGHRLVDDNATTLLADVDGNGKADLVTVGGAGSSTAGWVSVGLSSGSAFTEWSWTSGYRMLDDGSKVWLADVDNDVFHKADLVAQGPAAGGAAGWVVLGLASSGVGFTGFSHWTWTSGHRMLDDASTTLLADVDGNGKADLVTVGAPGGSNAGWVSVALSTGSAFTEWSWRSGARILDDGSKVWLADVDGDTLRKADLVAVGAAGGSAAGWVVVGLSGSGAGFSGFAHWSWTSGGRMVDDGASIWLADMNGDGRADLTAQAVQTGAVGGIFTGLSSGSAFGWWSWSW